MKKKQFYIIIRGPLGCGKTTIAEALSKILKAKHYEIDRILNKNNIKEWEDGYISIRSFIKTNEISAERAKKDLELGIPIIFEANFYFKEQIEDLIRRLDYPHYIFTLKAPLKTCVERDYKRDKTHGRDAATAVYKKTTSFDYGISIDVTKPIDETIKEIISHIQK